MDQHVLSKWPLKKSSQKGGDATTLRREEYHKLGYVVTCGEYSGSSWPHELGAKMNTHWSMSASAMVLVQ